MSPRFVGRTAELATIDAVLAEVVDRGKAALIELRGDPGIGKSAVAAQVVGRARDAGFTVVRGQAGELEREVPLGILVDAFGDHLRRVHRPTVDHQLDPLVAAELDLAVSTLTRAQHKGTPAERLATHRAVRALIVRLAASRPLLVVLDDLHWADEASLSLIGYLLRHPPPAAVAFVLVHRPRQSPVALAAALELARPSLRCERLDLGPLGATEVAELTGANAPAVRRLLQRSGGNAFVLEAIARGATFDDPANVDQFGIGDLPDPVSAAVLAEVGSLTVGDVVVIRAAAVAGDPFDRVAAAAAAGVVEADVLEALDRLVAADLVRPVDGRRLTFRHPIVRRVIYSSSPASWRLAAHRRLAAALETCDAPAELRARHVEMTATVGDMSAVDLLGSAAHQVLVGAPASAARWSRAALGLLPDTPSNHQQRIDLQIVNATALGTGGHLEDSAAALRGLLGDIPDDDLDLRARVAGFCGLIDALLGRYTEGQAVLTAELDRLEALERATGARSVELAAVTIDLAVGCMFSAEYAAMRDWAERARRRATEVGDGPLTVGALAARGFAAYYLGEIALARRCCSEAAALAAGIDDAAFAFRLDPLLHLGYLTQNVGPYADAIDSLDRALSLARQTGQQFLIPPIQSTAAMALVDLGRLADASRSAEDAYEGAVLLGNRYLEALASGACSHWAFAAGDLDTALECGRRGWALVGHVGSMVAANLGLHLANALLASGRAAEAHDVLLTATNGGDLSPVEVVQHARYHELFAVIALEVGDRDGAAASAVRAEESVAGIDFPRALMYAERTAAAVALALEEPDAAVRASAAATHGERAGMPVEAARARILAGRALAAAGDHDRALEQLSTAERRLSECGARRWRDEAADLLRTFGARPRRQADNPMSWQYGGDRAADG